MVELEFVAEEDAELNRQGKSAISKLTKLSHLTDVFSKKQLQQEFLDHGVLALLKNWLEPLPDGSLPNINIRVAVLQILNDFPIDLGQHDQKEQLQKSGLGKSLMKRPQPTESLLKNWWINGQSLNQPYLATLIKNKDYFANSSSRSSLVLQQQSTIADLITASKEGHFTVLGRAKLDTESGPHYYIACPKCLKQTTAAANQLYSCHTCREKQVATPRAKYNIIIYDNLTQLVVVGFGNVAEAVVGLPIQDLLACKLEDSSLNIQTINSKHPLSVPDSQKTLGPHYQWELFLQIGGLYTNATITPAETTDFGPGSSQTSEVIFTPEAVSNKRDSPIAHHSFDKGKQSCTNTGLSRKTAKISSTALLAMSATNDANNIKVGDIIVNLNNNLGTSQNDVDNFAQSPQ